MKSNTKTIDGAKIISDAKAKEKKLKDKKHMKTTTTTSSKKTVIVTVLITIASIAAIAGLLVAGFFIGTEYERGLNNRVQSEAHALTTATVAELKR